MAILKITKTPTAVPGLSANKSYTIQNTSPINFKIHEGASKPTNLLDAFVIRNDSSVKINKGTKSFYVWFEGYSRNDDREHINVVMFES